MVRRETLLIFGAGVAYSAGFGFLIGRIYVLILGAVVCIWSAMTMTTVLLRYRQADEARQQRFDYYLTKINAWGLGNLFSVFIVFATGLNPIVESMCIVACFFVAMPSFHWMNKAMVSRRN